MTLEELVVKIDADTRGLTRGMQQATRAVQSATADIARNAQLSFDFDTSGVRQATRSIDSATTEMARDLRDVGDAANDAGRDIEQGLGGALEEIETPIGNVSSLLAKLKGPAGFAAIGVGFAALGKGASSFASELLRSSDALGISAEALQRWRRAEQLAGAEAGTLTDFVEEMFSALSEGESGVGDVGKAMEDLGVDFRNATGEIRSAEELIPKVVAALAKIENPAERARAAYEILGEESVRLIGRMDELAGAMDEMSKQDVFSEKQLQDISRFDRALRELSVKVPGYFALALTSIEDWMAGIKIAFQRDVLLPIVQGLADLNRVVAETIERIPFGQIFSAPARQAEQDARDYAKTLAEGLVEQIKALAKPVTSAVADALGKGGKEGASTAGKEAGETFTDAMRETIARGMPDIGKILSAGIGTFTGVLEAGARDQARRIHAALREALTPGDVFQAWQTAFAQVERLQAQIGTAEFVSPEDITQLNQAEATLEHMAELWRELDTPKVFGFEMVGAGAARAPESRINQLIDDAVQNLADSLLGATDAIGYAIGQFAGGAQSFGSTLADIGSMVLNTIGQALGPVGGAIAGLITGFFDAIFGPSETAKNNAQIREAIGGIINEMQALDQIPEAINEALIQGVGVKLKDLGIQASTATQAVIENLNAVVEAFQAGATQQELVDLVLEKIKADLEETEEGLSEIASTISNIPTGFKTALARFQSTLAQSLTLQPGRPIVDGFAAPTATVSRDAFVVNGDINIQAAPGEDGEELLGRLEKAASERSVRGGTTVFMRTKKGTL